jgi:hypothetical protein
MNRAATIHLACFRVFKVNIERLQKFHRTLSILQDEWALNHDLASLALRGLPELDAAISYVSVDVTRDTNGMLHLMIYNHQIASQKLHYRKPV